MNIGSLLVRGVLLPLLLNGCAPLAPGQPGQPNQNVEALQAQVSELSAELSDLQHTIAAMHGEQQAVTTELDLQNRALGRVEAAVTTLPESLKQLCPPPRTVEAACKEPQLQRVVVSGTKMVVGEMEQVWLDPPGLPFTAHVDTSAGNNALRADGIVEFERDGKAWARFALHPPDSDRRIELERRVVSHLRSAQTGDSEGSKRPIVRLRLRLGDVEDTFSFVLTERTDQPYQVLLGRAFLKDIAIVDVGARYVQPRVKPPKAAAKAAEKAAPVAPAAEPPAQ